MTVKHAKIKIAIFVLHVEEIHQWDTTDSYRNSVKNGYYSSSIIEKRDKDGNFIGYAYNKPGE